MKTNRYECFWSDKDGVLTYEECENEVEVKEWFFKMIENGFYNLSVFEKESIRNEG